MQEVRVESLERLEALREGVRLSANSGELSIVFPKEIWEHFIASAPVFGEPEAAELAELERLREQLKAHAEENSFKTVLEGVRCGDSGLEYDLVLRPAGLFALTTGYHFAPVVDPDLMARIGACFDEGGPVEQVYAIGAVADEEALHFSDDENLRCLSIRGRRCSTSRFEMAPELWHTLHERLGWENVETLVGEER
jgi:hypothetical protein